MRGYTAVIERDPQTGLYVGYVPGLPGAHSQGETLEELRENLKEVLLLAEDGLLSGLMREMLEAQVEAVPSKRLLALAGSWEGELERPP